MLNDYIKQYIDAVQKYDTDNMRRIEKELASLGMDKMTLMLLAQEMIKEGIA